MASFLNTFYSIYLPCSHCRLSCLQPLNIGNCYFNQDLRLLELILNGHRNEIFSSLICSWMSCNVSIWTIVGFGMEFAEMFTVLRCLWLGFMDRCYRGVVILRIVTPFIANIGELQLSLYFLSGSCNSLYPFYRKNCNSLYPSMHISELQLPVSFVYGSGNSLGPSYRGVATPCILYLQELQLPVSIISGICNSQYPLYREVALVIFLRTFAMYDLDYHVVNFIT